MDNLGGGPASWRRKGCGKNKLARNDVEQTEKGLNGGKEAGRWSSVVIGDSFQKIIKIKGPDLGKGIPPRLQVFRFLAPFDMIFARNPLGVYTKIISSSM